MPLVDSFTYQEEKNFRFPLLCLRQDMKRFEPVNVIQMSGQVISKLVFLFRWSTVVAEILFIMSHQPCF